MFYIKKFLNNCVFIIKNVTLEYLLKEYFHEFAFLSNSLYKKKRILNSMLVHYKKHIYGIKKIIDLANSLKINYFLYNEFNDKFFLNLFSFLKIKKTVISFGGDGTLLKVFDVFGEKNLFIGLNSDEYNSSGALCLRNLNSIKDLFFSSYSEDKYKYCERLVKIYFYLNNVKYSTFNDLYFLNQNILEITKYFINSRGKTEIHKNSGLIISTPIGSTGSINSNGGAIQSFSDNKIQLLSREQYYENKYLDVFFNFFLNIGENIKITSCMPKSLLFLNNPYKKTIPIFFGETIKIETSKNKFNYIILSEDVFIKRELNCYFKNYYINLNN